MLVSKQCFERGCSCYDDRVDKDPVEVVKREWVGLTDDEAKRLWSENTGNQDPIGEDLEIIRNVEAYLKEKNL
jgi:hypothetical protein